MPAVYSIELRRRRIAETTATIRGPHDVAALCATLLEADTADREALAVIVLNTKNNVIGTEIVYRGNVNASLVRVAEVLRLPVILNATGIIIAHNHPSGDPAPSPDDLHLTAEVLAACRLFDIQLLDHVIVAEGGLSVSLRDRGIAFDR